MVAVRKRVERCAEVFDQIRPAGWARPVPDRDNFCLDTLLTGVFGSPKQAVSELMEYFPDVRKTTELLRPLGLMTEARVKPHIEQELDSLKHEWLKQIDLRLIA